MCHVGTLVGHGAWSVGGRWFAWWIFECHVIRQTFAVMRIDTGDNMFREGLGIGD